MHDLQTHIEHESQEDIPRLESALPKEEPEKIVRVSFAQNR